jgi:multidrug efflux pump subunit AcrA (membrane-fusion protein)
MKRGAWWLAGGAALVAVAAVVTFGLISGGDTAPAAPRVSKVARGAVTSTVSAAGTVQSQQSRTLGFSSTGTLTELNVKAGDTVAPGAVLAKIDATDAQNAVTAAQQSVDSAQDSVDNANAELAAANATPTPCASPTRGASPGAATRGAGPSVSASPSPTRAATPTCTSTNQPPRGNNAGTDALLSAQQRLNNAELALKQANLRLAGTVITAPIAGKVLSVAGAIGGQAGSNFIVIAGTSDMVVRAQFTEAEVADLALKQPAKITLPNKAGRAFTGTVIQIDPAGTVSNRLVRYAALIAFDTVPDGLLYGQSANVAVTTASADNVLYVPSTAVADRKDNSGTVTVMVGGQPEKRTVTLGLRGDVNTEVKSGLSLGDQVLTTAAT